MDPSPFLDRILDDEGLTGDLDEAEATVLVRALVERVRAIAAGSADRGAVHTRVQALVGRARQIAAVVAATRDHGTTEGRAVAARHGLRWPAGATTPAAVLEGLLAELTG
jgi:hypothetical protein